MTTSTEEIELRIERLQRELVDLQREVRRRREPASAEPFDALELSVAGDAYLLPITAIREVSTIVWPTPLPDSPTWVLGTFRYGERVVPMVDAGRRLNGAVTALDASLLLVVLDRPKWMALAVAGVGEVVRVDPARLEPPTPGIPQAAFVVGTLADRGDGGSRVLSPEILGREIDIDA